MSVTLTDEEYGALWHTLTAIARTYEVTETGGRRRLSKERVELIARDACDVVGWGYHGVATAASAPTPRAPCGPQNRGAREQFSRRLREHAIGAPRPLRA